MMLLTALFLFLQSGLGRPTAPTGVVRPYLAGGYMLAKGPFTADVPFIQVQRIDGKDRWFVGASIRYSLKVMGK